MKETEQEFPRVRPYSLYARIYDDLGQSDFCLALAPLIESAIRRHATPVRTVLDLACGTGTLSILLASKGYCVTGVDRSPEMLAIAREKAAAAGVSVDFRRQDMAHLRVRGTFDLILCIYDSLNYLLSWRRLEAAMMGVAAALAPEGLFVFDVNTTHCLATDWGNQVVEERAPRAALIHVYRYNPRSGIGTLELHCLHRTDSRVEKYLEVHRERGYASQDIRSATDSAGLDIVEEIAFPDTGASTEQASRVVYIASKRACPPEETTPPPGLGLGS